MSKVRCRPSKTTRSLPISSSSLTTQSNPKSQSVGLNEDDLAATKKKLKNPLTFKEAAEIIANMMKTYLNATNKQKFYGILLSVSCCIMKNAYYHCIGKKKYSLIEAQKLFDVALDIKCMKYWTPGYLRNIIKWKEIIDSNIRNHRRHSKEYGIVATPKPPRTINLPANSYNIVPFCREDKPYPFLEFADDEPLLKLTSIIHPKKKTQIFSFRFDINSSQIDLITQMKNDAIKYNAHLIIENTEKQYLVEFTLNDQPISIKVGNGRDIEFGYDVTELCVCGENILIHIAQASLMVSFVGRFHLANVSVMIFTFGISVVKSMTEKIMRDIKRNTISKKQSLAFIKNSFTIQKDVEEVYATISLLCPLGRMFIETPIRSKNCKHIQCFDLETFMLMNKKKKAKWTCPVCDAPAFIDDLITDSYMSEILTIVGNGDIAENTKINKNGEWELIDNRSFDDHSDGNTILKKRHSSGHTSKEIPLPKRTCVPHSTTPNHELVDLTI